MANGDEGNTLVSTSMCFFCVEDVNGCECLAFGCFWVKKRLGSLHPDGCLKDVHQFIPNSNSFFGFGFDVEIILTEISISGPGIVLSPMSASH